MSAAGILVINAGSSSVKLGFFVEREGDERAVIELLADLSAKRLTANRAGVGQFLDEDLGSFDPSQLLQRALKVLQENAGGRVAAVGHRIVHGGPSLREHQLLTTNAFDQLEKAVVFAPLHLPVALRFVHAASDIFPGLPVALCLDTAFHRTLPELAARLPLPDELWRRGVRRYGFHGLSCESIVHQLGDDVPERLIIAHLGSGASLTAVREGRSIETSMGLTPLGGIPMSTRSGDLDPGVLLYLLRQGWAADALEEMLEKHSGLLGISGESADMRALLASLNTRSTLAVETFCSAVARCIAEYMIVLGGLDRLIFTGGIGGHSSSVREQIVKRLGVLGAQLDEAENCGGDGRVSGPESAFLIEVRPSQEDQQIARHTRALCK